MYISINYGAVVVAAIAAMIIGALWYSPWLFAKQWMHLLGLSGTDMKKGMSPGQAMAGQAVLSLLTAYVLAHFAVLVGTTTLGSALQLGFWVWLGFVAPVYLSMVLFERRPFKLFLINAGCMLVTLLVMSAIVGYWM